MSVKDSVKVLGTIKANVANLYFIIQPIDIATIYFTNPHTIHDGL